jgi:hypothetical protein
VRTTERKILDKTTNSNYEKKQSIDRFFGLSYKPQKVIEPLKPKTANNFTKPKLPRTTVLASETVVSENDSSKPADEISHLIQRNHERNFRLQ